MENTGKMSEKTVRMVQLAILIAVIAMLQVTQLGYPKFGVVEMTIMSIPVIVGAMILGPRAGAFLGFLFGLTSVIQGIFFSPLFGAVLFSINWVYFAIMCMVPRILMGWLTGLIFRGLYRFDKTKLFSFMTASLAGSLLNTVLFMGSLLLLYGNSEYIQSMMTSMGTRGIIAFVIAFVGLNGLIEAVVCTIVGTAVGKALSRYIKPAKTKGETPKNKQEAAQSK